MWRTMQMETKMDEKLQITELQTLQKNSKIEALGVKRTTNPEGSPTKSLRLPNIFRQYSIPRNAKRSSHNVQHLRPSNWICAGHEHDCWCAPLPHKKHLVVFLGLRWSDGWSGASSSLLRRLYLSQVTLPNHWWDNHEQNQRFIQSYGNNFFNT